MGKMNWGTTAEVMGGIGTGILSKLKDRKEKKQATKYDSSGTADSSDYDSAPASPPSYHKGGKVRKTGLARLKKGERVLTKPQQRKAGLLKKR